MRRSEFACRNTEISQKFETTCLQQARQRADVFVRDVCPATKKVITNSITREHEHDQFHSHEEYYSCSNGRVSNEFGCFEI